jgi:hypothetical protein
MLYHPSQTMLSEVLQLGSLNMEVSLSNTSLVLQLVGCSVQCEW